MAVTATNEGEVLARTSSARLFLAARPVRGFLAMAVLLGALAGWFGMVETPIPTAVAQGTARVPLWRLLVMGVAVLPVLAMNSHFAELETVATRRLRSFQRIYLTSVSLGSAAIYLGICAFVMHPLVVMIMARSWIAWLGLALLAGALLGWRQAWTLPSIVAIVLYYWGYRGEQRYQWWEFSARPHDDLPSLMLSAALLAAGVIAYSATPWRRQRWIFWRR